MDEYIKREAALDIFGDVPMWNGYFEPYPWEVHCAIVGVTKVVKEEISKIPAADVVPVRHGRWICIRKGYGEYECSVCHGEDSDCSDYYGTHVVTEQAFCPNCGARMDLPEQAEEAYRGDQ